ncbi:hypothetical protein D8674_026460 [Pyrus ussuriensis x Pyrus communis]|uniref:Uncharacterized protein n=1 Tax=Pyrus ussuriensis x Pyrus communis TaxID=2448454 RepID=A0A5N5I6Y7_9ROSA|nr:hypothetical protein D8674_026460 [Pyrus ussuriensis x Pyrus communis]
MDSFGKLGQSLGVIDEHVLMSNISDLNEIAHDDKMIDTSMAIIPFVENNDGENNAQLMPIARSGPFNLDLFIFGPSGPMQGRGQRKMELPELGKRHTREQEGGKSENVVKKRAVVMESMKFSRTAADEDQPRQEQ